MYEQSLFISDFGQFDYHVSKCISIWVHSRRDYLNFLNRYIHFSLQNWFQPSFIQTCFIFWMLEYMHSSVGLCHINSVGFSLTFLRVLLLGLSYFQCSVFELNYFFFLAKLAVKFFNSVAVVFLYPQNLFFCFIFYICDTLFLSHASLYQFDFVSLKKSLRMKIMVNLNHFSGDW